MSQKYNLTPDLLHTSDMSQKFVPKLSKADYGEPMLADKGVHFDSLDLIEI